MTPSDQSNSEFRIGVRPDHGAALEDLDPEQLTNLLDALFDELGRRWRNAIAGASTTHGRGEVPR